MPFLMPFGKWKDRDLSEIPSNYLQWLLRVCRLSTGLLQAVREELASRGVAIPEPPAPKPPPSCGHCGGSQLVLSWLQQRNGRRQIRRACARCGSGLRFAPQTAENVAEADRFVSQTAILDVLVELDRLGIELQSDGASC